MNDSDRLQDLVDALRQPSTSSETALESQMIDSFTNAIQSTEGTTMQMISRPRRLRVASFVAAGIIGFGGVAAAGPAVLDTVTGDDEPTSEQPVEETLDTTPDSVPTTDAPAVTVSDTAVATTVPATTVAPAGDVISDDLDTVDDVDAGDDVDEAGDPSDDEVVDDPDTAFDETECAEGNHGKTVSSVAKQTPSGPGKGATVAEAAQSSCGKTDTSTSDDDDDDDDVDDDSESDDVDDDADEDSQSDDDADDAGRNESDRDPEVEDSVDTGRSDRGNSAGQGEGKGDKSNGDKDKGKDKGKGKGKNG